LNLKTNDIQARTGLRWFLAGWLLLGLLGSSLRPGKAVSAQATPYVWVNPAQGQVVSGASVQVELVVIGGENVNAFDISIRYNPDLVTLDSWQYGTYLSNLWTVYTQNNPGDLRLAAAQLATPGVTGDGVLLKLFFSGLAPGQTDLLIDNLAFSDPLGNGISVSTVSGSLLVLAEAPPELTQAPTSIPSPTFTAVVETPVATQVQPTQALEPGAGGSPTVTFSLRDTLLPPGVTLTATPDGWQEPTVIQPTVTQAVENSSPTPESSGQTLPNLEGGSGQNQGVRALLEGILWGLLVTSGIGIVGFLVLLALRRKKS
jgi:hypothetical protein